MESPRKRRRLSDQDADLNERRARNNFRLKSIFESIFEKYGRDFDGIGDEIDMRTGEIVVNNGHVLGMKNERDAGDMENSEDEFGSDYSSEENLDPADSNDTNQEVPVEEQGAANVPSTCALESANSIEDADSLMGDVVELENPTIEQVTALEGGPATQDVEEDELASSNYNWLSPRKVRSIAQDRWRLQELESVNREAIDPAWRAPPLPKTGSLHWEPPKHSKVTFEHEQADPDSRIPGTSIWALEESKPRRRQPTASRASLGSSLTQIRDGIDTSQARHPLWTQEEDDLLRHLKSTTNLTARDMEPYFPLRHKYTIGVHWSSVRRRDELQRRTGVVGQAEQNKSSSFPLSSGTPDLTEVDVQEYHQCHDTGDLLKDVWLVRDSSKAEELGFDSVLDGLGKRVEEAFDDHQGQHNAGPHESVQQMASNEEDVVDLYGNLSATVSSPHAVQPSRVDRTSYSSVHFSEHGSLGSSSSTACLYPSVDGTMAMAIDHTTHEVSQQQCSIESQINDSVSLKGLKSFSIEADAAMRRSQCIEDLRTNGITEISINDDFHVAEPTVHVVGDETLQFTTSAVSSSKPSPEAQNWCDQVEVAAGMPSMSQVPRPVPATSQNAPPSPLLAEDQVLSQPLTTPLSSDQYSASQTELEAIDTPSPSRRPAIQIVILPAARSKVLEKPPLAAKARSSLECLEKTYDATQVDASPMNIVEESSCGAGESSVSMPQPTPTHPAPGKFSPIFIDIVDSEDELSTPAVHPKFKPLTGRNSEFNKERSVTKASSGLDVFDYQPRSRLGLQALSPDRRHNRPTSSSKGRRISGKLPLRGSGPPQQQNTKITKAEIADSFESISTAIVDDCSEDELA